MLQRNAGVDVVWGEVGSSFILAYRNTIDVITVTRLQQTSPLTRIRRDAALLLPNGWQDILLSMVIRQGTAQWEPLQASTSYRIGVAKQDHNHRQWSKTVQKT